MSPATSAEPRPEPSSTTTAAAADVKGTTGSLQVNTANPSGDQVGKTTWNSSGEQVVVDVVVQTKKAGTTRSNKKDVLKSLIKDIAPEDLREMDLEELKKGDDGSSVLRWTKAEDELLRSAVKRIGPRGWKRIATEFLCGTRTDIQCLHRWQKVLRPGLVKGPWTDEEDRIIVECKKAGISKWSEIAEHVKGRIGKQCRERWFNHLDPNIKRGEWTEEEDMKLFEGQAKLGNKWSQIARFYVPGRPENAVKNRWNAATRRRRSSNKRNKEDGSVITRNPRPAGERSKRQKTMTKVQARFSALKKEKKQEEQKVVGMAMDGMLSLSMLAAASQVVNNQAAQAKVPTKTPTVNSNAKGSGLSDFASFATSLAGQKAQLPFKLDISNAQYHSNLQNLITPTAQQANIAGSATVAQSPPIATKAKPTAPRVTSGSSAQPSRAMTFGDIPTDMSMEDTLAALHTLARGNNNKSTVSTSSKPTVKATSSART